VSDQARIDKWLWAVRLFKTRTLAAATCRNGHVLVEGQRVKPSREVRPGDLISVLAGGVQRRVKVIGSPPARVGAKLVGEFMEDLTPEAEFQKAREARAGHSPWPQGMGRPTKKNRRLWEKFGSENDP
jgi:ribosome-associated heat shock protein Hsp15